MNIQPKVTPSAMLEMVRQTAIAKLVHASPITALQGATVGEALAVLRAEAEGQLDRMTIAELKGLISDKG